MNIESLFSFLLGRASRQSRDFRRAPAESAPTLIPIIIIFVLFYLIPVQADIIFPARIEIKQASSHEFDVVFILPIVNNKKLKAELVLPPVCTNLTEHEIKTTYTSYIETWKIACEPEQLFGESIEIKGLLGTYVEIMLTIEMLDGRTYNTTLKPSKAKYLIAYPPSIFNLIGQSAFSGIRHILLHPEIYLFLFLLVFFIPQRRSLILGLIAYLMSHLMAQYLVQNQLLMISPYLPSFLILVIVLFPAFDLIQGKPALRRWFQPLWLLMILIGFLSGGIIQKTSNIEGLSNSEQNILILGQNIGIAIGLILAYFLIKEFKQLLTMFVLRTRPQKAHIILGYIVGVFACAFIFYQSTVLFFVPSLLPYLSFEFFIFPVLYGFWVWKSDSIQSLQAITLFTILLIF